jgi:hypothetical protein
MRSGWIGAEVAGINSLLIHTHLSSIRRRLDSSTSLLHLLMGSTQIRLNTLLLHTLVNSLGLGQEEEGGKVLEEEEHHQTELKTGRFKSRRRWSQIRGLKKIRRLLWILKRRRKSSLLPRINS